METAQQWASQEFGTAELGDARRSRRLVKLAASFAERPAGKITEVMQVPAEREAAFRFVENGAIESAAIARAHHRATAERCGEVSDILVPVDQTSLAITDRIGKTGFGRVGGQKSDRTKGLQVTSALAVTADGVSEGLLAQHWWSRQKKTTPPKWKKDRRPAEERESILWRLALESAEEALREKAPNTRAWYQMDRGADSSALLELVTKRGIRATFRSAYSRKLEGGGYLHAHMLKQPVLHRYEVAIPARKKKLKQVPARVARLSLRAAPVEIVTTNLKGKRMGTVNLYCVHVRETRPPRWAKRLEWWLLTTVPAKTADEAIAVVNAYRVRWRVEEFHRAWKSGVCRVEDSQLHSADAFKRWATIGSAVAARTERIKTASRQTPDADAETEFSREEIDAAIILYKASKHSVGDQVTLSEAVDMIARLGGYIGKSSGGPPGVRVIQRGLDRLQGAVEALEWMRKK